MTRLAVALANLLVALSAIPGCARSADQPLSAQLDAVFQEAHADGEFNGNVPLIAILSNDQDTDVLGLRTKVLRLMKRDAR